MIVPFVKNNNIKQTDKQRHKWSFVPTNHLTLEIEPETQWREVRTLTSDPVGQLKQNKQCYGTWDDIWNGNALTCCPRKRKHPGSLIQSKLSTQTPCNDRKRAFYWQSHEGHSNKKGCEFWKVPLWHSDVLFSGIDGRLVNYTSKDLYRTSITFSKKVYAKRLLYRLMACKIVKLHVNTTLEKRPPRK